MPEPEVTLLKSTNGVADSPPGPFIPVGEGVTWTYLVENTGNVTLSGITVTDDPEVDVTCPATPLPVGETLECTATGVSEAGEFTNLATVTATDPDGTTVTDEDRSHYVGSQPGIAVLKRTNGEPADQVPGPFVPVGDPVT